MNSDHILKILLHLRSFAFIRGFKFFNCRHESTVKMPVPRFAWHWPGLVALACASCTADPSPRRAPMADDARAASQLVVSGNACGPAALLNSLRFADARWSKTLDPMSSQSDRDQLLTIIHRHGLRQSPHLARRPRWSRRGINVVDLTDVANEITSPRGLPEIRYEVLIANSNETTTGQLSRTHRQLERSLARGLPPMLSIRRYAMRGGDWVVIDAHFVTVTEVPRRLPRDAESFAITYIDPWDAQHHEGGIRVLTDARGGITPFLEADFKNANVGKSRIRPGENTKLTAAAAIGCF